MTTTSANAQNDSNMQRRFVVTVLCGAASYEVATAASTASAATVRACAQIADACRVHPAAAVAVGIRSAAAPAAPAPVANRSVTLNCHFPPDTCNALEAVSLLTIRNSAGQFTPEQVRWAMSHDWCIATAHGAIVVADRFTVHGGPLQEVIEVFAGSFADLRDFAGY